MDLVSQQHWDEQYAETEFSRPDDYDFLRLIKARLLKWAVIQADIFVLGDKLHA